MSYQQAANYKSGDNFKQSLIFEYDLAIQNKERELNHAISDEHHCIGTPISLPYKRIALIKQQIAELIHLRNEVLTW